MGSLFILMTTAICILLKTVKTTAFLDFVTVSCLSIEVISSSCTDKLMKQSHFVLVFIQSNSKNQYFIGFEACDLAVGNDPYSFVLVRENYG